MSSIVVTLEQMYVKQKVGLLGLVDAKIPQMRIWGQIGTNPKVEVGLVGTQPDAPINIRLPDLPEELHDEIVAQVKSQLATAGDEVGIVPATNELRLYRDSQEPDDGDDDVDDADPDPAA